MSACMLVYGNNKADLTCQMRDADAVIRLMDEHEMTFEKKYTSLHGKDVPGTITFNGVRPKGYSRDTTALISDLNELCLRGIIGNVYFVIRSDNAMRTERKSPRFGPGSEGNAHEKHAFK